MSEENCNEKIYLSSVDMKCTLNYRMTHFCVCSFVYIWFMRIHMCIKTWVFQRKHGLWFTSWDPVKLCVSERMNRMYLAEK